MIGNRDTSYSNDWTNTLDSYEREDSRLHLTVLYTTLEGTLSAVLTAGLLARNLNARIALVRIQVVSYHLSFERTPVPIWFSERLLGALASQTGLDDVAITLCLCRDKRQCLEQVLRPRSLVVLGGTRGWFSKERKVEQCITSLGHKVVFVDLNRVPKMQQQAQMHMFLESMGLDGR